MKKPSKLVSNDAAPAKVAKIQSFTLNLLPKLVRMDKMEGRDFVVVPMVILTEGVHAGSDGPLYYPKAELEKTPVVWNHKPVVVYHPEMNGQGISACDPAVITNRKVGVMMNTRFENGALKSEAWLEADRANLVDNRIMEAVNKNEMMEVSTGVFVDMEATPGEWNGEAYNGIARNYRPDHLALLPDKVGACSIKDGAGFMRNQAGKAKVKIPKAVEDFFTKMGLSMNEMSHSNIRDSLAAALRKKYNVNDQDGPWLWVADVYSNFVIYEWDNKLWRLGFTSTDAGVTLSTDEPTEVVRVTEYRTATGTFVGNNQTKTEMKKTLIDNILKLNGWTEADRPKLEALSEDQLKTLAPTAPTGNAPPPEPAPAPSPAPAPAAAPAPAPVANSQPQPAKVVSLKEYVDAAPPELRGVLTNSVEVYNQEKAALVKVLTENKNCGFTAEDLNNRPLGELRILARMAGAPAATVQPTAPLYAGQALAPVDNSGAVKEEPLAIPTMNFAAPAAK